MDRDTVTQEHSETVKTTVQFDADLLERAKIAAVRAKTTLQQLCAEGLELRLKQLEKSGGR